MNRGIIIKSFTIIFLTAVLINVTVFAQETDAEKYRDAGSSAEGQPLYQGSRGYSLSKDNNIQAQGLAKYFRFGVHDGNLVSGGLTNSGLLSYHYVSNNPTISWPKGSNAVSYIHSAVFFVAAEVVDSHGDTIHIVSDNYRRSNREMSLDQSHWYSFMPLPKYFNNHQTNSIDWDMDGISEDVGIDGLPNTGDEGEGDGQLQTEEDFNKNGVLDLSMVNTAGWFAMSHRKDTWPRTWPAGSFPGDDRQPGEERAGVRDGRWNGEYGAYVRADQESYYVMDDRENDEFSYYPFEDEESKQNWPNGRRGLGITVEVRNYQWSSRLAEDILISIYDITNYGKDLKKAVVGMMVDPDLGGSLSGDEASFDEIDDITYTWTRTGVANNGLPIGYFGFAFLESPGLSNDGIDNDDDGLIDESQYNDIDEDGDWTTWSDLNANGIWDNEDINFNGILDEGEDINNNGRLDSEPLNDDVGSDGIGPDMEDYTGPDADGTEGNGRPDQGEPNFGATDNDESDQVGLTSFYLRDVDDTMADDERFWNIEIQPGNFLTRPGYQRDIAFIYGSGFVEIPSGKSGTQRYAIALLFGNDEEDILRNKKTMQVIYNEDYNFSKPPRKPLLTATAGDGMVFLEWDDAAERTKDPVYGNDFEAYYIYKSTDPTFEDIKTITDAYGNELLYKPVAIYDVKNGLKGIHPVRIGSEVGEDSDLGVSYNMGTDSGLKHHYIDTDVTNGRTYYYAVVSVDRGYMPEFYERGLSEREGLLTISPTECSATIQTDQLGRPISFDRNTAMAIPSEPPAGWVTPSVDTSGISHVSGSGTGSISVEVVNPNLVKDNNRYRIEFFDDGSFKAIDTSYTGLTSRAAIVDVNRNLNMTSITDPDKNERAEEFIEDGFKVTIKNDTLISIDTLNSKWETGSSSLVISDQTKILQGTPVARDYEIRVSDSKVDTSVTNVVTNFQVWDVTDLGNEIKIKYRFVDKTGTPDAEKGMLSESDRLILVSSQNTSKRLWIFDFVLPSSASSSSTAMPAAGDVYKVVTSKPFDRYDAFEFTMKGNNISSSKAKADLDNIYTVPDPYLGVSSLERKVINEDEGRGDRRIDFVNLPAECKISIFTVSGRLVRELEHTSTVNDSRLAWDLRTKDGLEIAHGVYFYVVEAPGIGKKVGRFAVIK
jgi:hypothetical protein